MKSANWISATGSSPLIAAPIAVPTMFDSASGVSITRSSPNSASSPSVALKTPPFRPTSSPSTITRSSRAISSRRAERTASITVIVAIAIPPFSPPGPAPRSAGVHVPEDRFRRRIRRALGELGGVIDLALHAADRLFQQRVVQQPHLAQIVAEARERLALPPLLHLLARAIGAVVVIAGMRY